MKIRLSAVLLILILLLSIIASRLINNTPVEASSDGDDINSNVLEIDPYPSTRALNDSAYTYLDKENDVWLVDYRSEKYEENNWFDIKTLSTEPSAGTLWLNMTMNDNIQDDEDIYYKMSAADAEVVLFLGRGEVIYKDSTESTVQYSGNKISAEIDLDKSLLDIVHRSIDYWQCLS